ncbi:MAG TPA: hypothetical protein VK168_01860 [Saprospiraceae bacterium]|nr:hypothetical protein [Saprospiraceae bacterium]
MLKYRNILIRNNENLENSVEKKSNEFSCAKTRSVFDKAKQINSLTEKTLQSIEDLLEAGKTNPSKHSAFAYQNLLVDDEEKAVFRQKIGIFRDSLTLLIDSDSTLSKQISEACIANEDLLNSARTDQKVMYLLGLELRLLTLVHQALTRLEEEITVHDPIPDRILPAISLNTQCIKAGKPFSGDLFGIPYSSQHDSTLRFFVNNQEMPNEGGIGKVKLPAKGKSQQLELSIHTKHPFEDSYQRIVETMLYEESCKN